MTDWWDRDLRAEAMRVADVIAAGGALDDAAPDEACDVIAMVADGYSSDGDLGDVAEDLDGASMLVDGLIAQIPAGQPTMARLVMPGKPTLLPSPSTGCARMERCCVSRARRTIRSG